MGIKTYNPYTPSRRHMTGSDNSRDHKEDSGEVLLVFLEEELLAVTTRVRSL